MKSPREGRRPGCRMNEPARRVPIACPVTGDDECRAAGEAILSGWLTQGPRVAAFEKAFAARHRVAHAVAVSSCTAGLHLALEAVGVGPGDEVIVPAFTWVASANAVVYCGARPVFADIDRTTFNLDPGRVAGLVSRKTRALVAVHLFGLCADVPALRRAIPARVAIVEDAACAAGAAIGNTPAGGLGDVAVFSFHPRKSITTGEGGMITTNNPQIAAAAAEARNHGASVPEEERHAGPRPWLMPAFRRLGYNYRMTDIQGAVGLVQLGKLDSFIAEREKRARWYRERLGDLDWLRPPRVPPGFRHGWQSFVTMVDPSKAPMSRDRILEKLQERGVGARPGTHAVHALDYYRDRFKLEPGDFPVALECRDRSLAIPLHNRMDEEDYLYVASVLRELDRR